MKKWYNSEEDIMNLEISNGEYWKSIELSNGVIIDLDKEGNIKSIEILRASKIFSGDAKKVIENN